MTCPIDLEGVHRMTGDVCGCGYVMRILPIHVSIEVTNGSQVLVDKCFNCDDIETVLRALREAKDLLERKMI